MSQLVKTQQAALLIHQSCAGWRHLILTQFHVCVFYPATRFSKRLMLTPWLKVVFSTNHSVQASVLFSYRKISLYTAQISKKNELKPEHCGWWWWWYHSLTAHQHQKGHTVPKQVIMIATSIQVATVYKYCTVWEQFAIRPSLNKMSDKTWYPGAPRGGCSHAPQHCGW